MGYRNEPSCPSQMAAGAIMGGSMGGIFGSIFGLILGVVNRVRFKEVMLLSGRSALQSGVAFGFFLAIGTALRCEDDVKRFNLSRYRS